MFDRSLREDLPAEEAIKPTAATAPAIFAERPVGFIALSLIAAALWASAHSFGGILGDANVYIGRALADLDPNGVGRDMMFVHDGQSRFSLFPLILDHLVGSFGTEPTAIALAILSILAWTAALAVFASRYVARSFIPIIVIFVAVMPINYGAPFRFGFSEVLAVPRPFAEALVLTALAALAFNRTLVAIACLLVASLLHPLMALAGWGVLALVLCFEHKRWAVAVAGLALLVLIGAFAGVPVLHRLVTVMDPDLKAFALSRSPLLFPSQWPLDYLGSTCAEAASLIVAASLTQGRARLILLGAIGVGVAGILAQIVFGDFLSLLLVVQVQLWRMGWLLAALGSTALGFAMIGLWQQGPKARMVLALLALAWLANETPETAALFAGSAVLLHFFGARLPITKIWAIALWVFTGSVAAILTVHYLTGFAGFIAHMPDDGSTGMNFIWSRRYIAFPILALVLPLSFSRQTTKLISAAALLTAVVLGVTVLRFWDNRCTFQKLHDASVHPAELTKLIAGEPGEILWVDGLTETWYLTGRAQWASPQQGVSTIFSPELAREWRERMQFLIKEGLTEKGVLSATHVPSTAELPHVTEANVAHLCARPDAPAWIVAPVGQGTTIPPGLTAHEWRLPQPVYKMTEESASYAWQRIDGYAIMACAHKAPEPR